MITKAVIEEIVDGLSIAERIVSEELEQVRKEMERYFPGSSCHQKFFYQRFGMLRILHAIEKQKELLKK